MYFTRFLLLLALFTPRVLAQFPTFFIDRVLDAASYTEGIARGSIFVVKGSGICPMGLSVATPPYQDNLEGVSVEVARYTSGSKFKALILHTYDGVQIGAILPSNVPAGAYRVTVTRDGKTTPEFIATVMDRKFRLFTNNQQGFGTAVAQNWISTSRVDRNMFATGTVPDGQTKGPAQPGQTVILWGTGLGPIDGPDGEPPGVIDLRGEADVTVVVGGKKVSPIYAGRAPQFPGADQINFTIPLDVPLACNVTLQVLVDGQAANENTLSIAPASASSCEHPMLTASQLERLDQGESLNHGHFILSAMTVPLDPWNLSFGRVDEITGGFELLDAGSVGSFTVASSSMPPGRCSTLEIEGSLNDATPTPLYYGSYDGGDVTLTGPNLNNRSLNGDDDYYHLLLAARDEQTGASLFGPNNLPIVPGVYSVQGPGGSYIGPFEATLTVPEVLRWTNRDSTNEVQRSEGLLVNWSGGAADDYVYVMGVAATIIGGSSSDPELDGRMFYCTALASESSLFVGPELMIDLPAVSNNGTSNLGMIFVFSTSPPFANEFTAPLVAGGSIDLGTFSYMTAIMKLLPYR